jgi:quercetin dioxygenase-like cupin family protein
MALPEQKITAAGNLWIRQMLFKNSGDANDGHTHNYDHLTLLAYGSVKVYVEDKSKVFTAPQMIFIKKGKSHHIEALEPNTVAYCVHALRDRDTADILDESQIPAGIDLSEVFKIAKDL